MKLITAIIRPEKVDEVIQSVADSGAHGLTVTEVCGFGRQYGQLTAGVTQARPTLVPKIRLDIVARAGDAEAIAETIAKRASTGTIGDGKIWVSDVCTVLRVRTGERDRNAL